MFAYLNLVNYDERTVSLLLLPNNFAFLSYFKSLEPLNFHKQVELLLLFDPLLLEHLVLLKLLVPYGNDFRVEDHLVHVLHIVKLFIELSLSFAQNTGVFLPLRDLGLSGHHFLLPLTVHLLHARFSFLGLLLLSFPLLLRNLSVLFNVRRRFDFSRSLHSLDI